MISRPGFEFCVGAAKVPPARVRNPAALFPRLLGLAAE